MKYISTLTHHFPSTTSSPNFVVFLCIFRQPGAHPICNALFVCFVCLLLVLVVLFSSLVLSFPPLFCFVLLIFISFHYVSICVRVIHIRCLKMQTNKYISHITPQSSFYFRFLRFLLLPTILRNTRFRSLFTSSAHFPLAHAQRI